MRMDLHCHTKKTKTGDAQTRSVTKDLFVEKIEKAKVKIIAITNHNHFDYEQFKILKESVKAYCDVWPGVELDIIGKEGDKGDRKRGHLLVIANPKNVECFNKRVIELIGKETADSFITDVNTVYKKLDSCDVIYIPHYHKEPRLSDEDIMELNNLIKDESRLFKETSDYRSLGVLSNFDYSVIIGSDVQDWNKYEDSKFADIRLPIRTFEQFCLLAKKDRLIIDTLLNQKRKCCIEVSPHKDVYFKIPIYEDVNVIFGQKGTGKTEIIKSLCQYYEENSIIYKCYIGNEKDNDFNKLMKIDERRPDAEKLGIINTHEQFMDVYNWQDALPIPIKKYVDWWKTKDNNRNKSKMKITDCVKMEVVKKKNELDRDYNRLKNFLASNFFEIDVEKYLKDDDANLLKQLIQKLCNQIYHEKIDAWKKEKTIKLTNWSIERIKNIADKCSDTVSKPSTTGFYEYASNRFTLYENMSVIQKTFEIDEKTDREFLGTLEEKGDIYIQTRYRMLCKVSKTDEFQYGIKKLRDFKENINKIVSDIAVESIGEYICVFKKYYEEGVTDISHFIGVSKDTILENGEGYTPSNGERGILLLQRLLNSEYDVYLLDEPELGMGNSYITATILPKIVDLAKQRKTVIVATHNANLAVSSLPYTSILRTHRNGTYNTYIGNPFCDELVNIDDAKDVLSWTKESLHTLEGGKSAFYGRRDIYESGKQDN